jgi:hypothetical protein
MIRTKDRYKFARRAEGAMSNISSPRLSFTAEISRLKLDFAFLCFSFIALPPIHKSSEVDASEECAGRFS